MDLMRGVPSAFICRSPRLRQRRLLLMTNDGALAQKLTKAGSHVPKTYLVKVSGKPDPKALARLRAGVIIDSTTAAPSKRRQHRFASHKTPPIPGTR